MEPWGPAVMRVARAVRSKHPLADRARMLPGRPPASGQLPDTRRVNVLGVVLCGGRSRRMGFDKGAAELGGTTLVERAAAALAEVSDRVLLAAGSLERYADLGLARVADDVQLLGPAAGIVAALEGGTAPEARCEDGAAPDRGAALDQRLDPGTVEWALVLACDMPRVPAALLDALLERARALELDACLLTSERGEEPLCGVYRRTVVPAMRAAQRAGRLRVSAFRDFPRADGEPVRLGWIDARELRLEGLDDSLALNLNTPEELLLERRRCLHGGSA